MPTSKTSFKWISLKDCVWNTPPCLQSKFSLSLHYPDCEELFCIRLQVKDATMTMVVDDLITFTRKASTKENVQIIKSMLMALVNYLEKDWKSVVRSEIERLRGRAFLPVCEAGESVVSLKHSRSSFFIPDRQALYDSFKDSLPLLDFTVDQVRHLRPLFDSLGISEKSLLTMVTEMWNPVGVRLEDTELTDELRSKSEALFRCARHFGSKKARAGDDTVLEQLRTLRVVRVDHIRLLQTVSSQGFAVVKETAGEMHFDETMEGLSLYLPLDEAQMTAVWSFYLPQRLMRLLQVSNIKAQPIFSSILQLSGAPLEEILDFADIGGMTPVDTQTGQTSASGVSVSSSMARTDARSPSPKRTPVTKQDHLLSDDPERPRIGTPAETPALASTSTRSSLSAMTVTNQSEVLFGAASTPQTPATPGSRGPSPMYVDPSEVESPRNNPWAKPTSVELQRAFPDLRDRMQAVATSAEGFEFGESDFVSSETLQRGSQDALDLGSLRSSLPILDGSPGRSSRRQQSSGRRISGSPRVVTVGSASNRTDTQRRTDFGIGFMGEFFVVTLLRKVFPDFDPERDWASGLRGWARLYDGYKDLSEYTKHEISDITYNDVNGAMTKWLVSKGYERAERWLSAPPIYHLEVKTTTGECEDRFFMSNNQVKLAEEMTVTGALPKKVYVIFRVFHVNQSPDLRVYLDPWVLFQEEELVLTPEGYSVKPRQSP